MTNSAATMDQLISEILPEERVAILIEAAKSRVGDLAEDVALSPAQFAALMELSERKVGSMRVDGTGPNYLQGGIPMEPWPKKGRKRKAEPEEGDAAPRKHPGTNQHVRYRLGDIRVWCEKTKVSRVSQAAHFKGQTFVNTLADLAQEAAYYVNERGEVEGAVASGTLAELLEAEDGDIVFLPVHEAAASTWTDLASHRRLVQAVQRVLSREHQRLDAAVEKSEIRSVSREAPRRGSTSA
ncbi:MAG: hypothetical protein Q8R82_12170 [Hyphomonadaceae bacterium]|nr:hypothetical protein [Hyphomonadaceae bacterium]